ncbi:HAD family hydrolase [bacterium]|nr:HAD family hydrolase [bacterium]
MKILANNEVIFENIDTIIWDKDATIIDANYFWAEITKRRADKILSFYSLNSSLYPEICKNMGLDVISGKLIPLSPVAVLSREEVLLSLHNKLIALGVQSNEIQNDRLFSEVHEEFQHCACDYIHLLPSVEDLVLAFARNNFKQFIITSDIKENALLSVQKFGLETCFLNIYGKHQFDEPKKTGIPLLQVIKENNLNPKTTLCIGDAEMDYLMAKNAGVPNVLLLGTGHTPLSYLQALVKTSYQDLTCISVE